MFASDRHCCSDRGRYLEYLHVLFGGARLRLTSSNLFPASLGAIPAIGPYCTRLTVSIVHSASPQVHHGPRHSYDPYKVFPLLVGSYLDASDRHRLLSAYEQVLPAAHGSLVELSLALDKWKHVFLSLYRLQDLRLRTSGVPRIGSVGSVAHNRWWMDVTDLLFARSEERRVGKECW